MSSTRKVLQSLNSAKNLPTGAAVVVEAAAEAAAAVDAAGEAAAAAMPLGAHPGEAATTARRASDLTQLTDANGQGRVLLDPAVFCLFCAAEVRQRSSDDGLTVDIDKYGARTE
jgi:hypothetical protein